MLCISSESVTSMQIAHADKVSVTYAYANAFKTTEITLQKLCGKITVSCLTSFAITYLKVTVRN